MHVLQEQIHAPVVDGHISKHRTPVFTSGGKPKKGITEGGPAAVEFGATHGISTNRQESRFAQRSCPTNLSGTDWHGEAAWKIERIEALNER
ncbi:MAG: hypothetical protein WDZ30_01960 [Cellvibrionaceae bacterium]